MLKVPNICSKTFRNRSQNGTLSGCRVFRRILCNSSFFITETYSGLDKTVYVNHCYFYIDDEEFGPLFVKICSYAPWSVKLCLNGHEWAKRQLDKRHVSY